MHMYYWGVIYNKKLTILPLELYYLCNSFFLVYVIIFYGFMKGTRTFGAFFYLFLKRILLSMKSRDSCLWIWATRDMNTYLYFSHISLWSINFLRLKGAYSWPRVLSNCNIPRLLCTRQHKLRSNYHRYNTTYLHLAEGCVSLCFLMTITCY